MSRTRETNNSHRKNITWMVRPFYLQDKHVVPGAIRCRQQIGVLVTCGLPWPLMKPSIYGLHAILIGCNLFMVCINYNLFLKSNLRKVSNVIILIA